MSVGATVFGALLGRKTLSTSTLGRATTAARGVGRASKEQEDVKRAQENVDAAKQALEDLDAQIAEETAAIAARFDADASKVETTVARAQARPGPGAVRRARDGQAD